MAKKSRKQRQHDVHVAVAGPIILIGFWIMIEFQVTNVYYMFGLPLIAAATGGWTSSFVPDMRRKENKHKNMYTGLPNKQKAQKKTSLSKPENKSAHTPENGNLLRTEKDIMTLPLQDLSWREFEELCYLYYKAKGYKPRRTPEGADGGVDLVIFNRHHNTDIAVQIKHYKKGKQVDVKLIRELDSARKNYGCVLAEMITSYRFTNPALVEADARRIECRGIEWVESKMLSWRAEQAKKKGWV